MTLISIPIIAPVTFLSRSSPAHHLALLSRIYSELGGRQGATKTLPGQWLRLSLASLSWNELSQLAQGNVPARFSRREWQWLDRAIGGDLIGKALRLGLEGAKQEGLEVEDVVTILGALCQCWNGPNPAVRESVVELAERKVQEPKTPDISEEYSTAKQLANEENVVEFDARKVQEPRARDIWDEYSNAKQLANEWASGRSLDVGNARVWTASHVGPVSGEGLENQDAVFAERVGEDLVFALADGVGSSAGAGAAARLAAVTFSQAVGRTLLDDNRTIREAFEGGLSAVYRAARDLAERLSREDRRTELVDVAPFLDPGTTLYFVRETLAGVIDRPALCTTIIGGILRPNGGNWVLECIRVGDGIVETVSPDRVVNSILNMNRDEIGLGAVLSPVRKVTDSEVESVATTLSPGSWVVVSSDGLPKGHSDALWSRLQSLTPSFDQDNQSNTSTMLAASLLQRASTAGRTDPSGTLFMDNLSLILISVS